MLEIRELYASLTASAAISTVAFFWLYFSRFSRRGVLWWAMAMTCYLLCLILTTYRGFIPPFFSVLVANVSATAGYVFFWFGIRVFFSRSLTRKVWWCGITLITLVIIASEITLFDPRLVTSKVLITSLNYATINILIAYELIRNARQSNTAKGMGGINLLNAIIIIYRGIHIVRTESFNLYFITGWTTSAYILWTNASLLLTTVGLILLILEELNAKLTRQAIEDPLTGLLNRRALYSITPEDFLDLQNTHTSLGLLMLDIDHFKLVNDTYGHIIGDTLLKHFAEEVSCCLRSTDILYRIGGEEFLIIAHGVSPLNTCALGERIRKHIEQTPLVTSHGTIHHTVSIGYTMTTPDDTYLKPVLERADSALYYAKNHGRNRVEMSLEAA
ncbi:GGDEF domain-containing protein [Halodesulfovibrio aestuarii]|uniref:diguanylate cyclase n=1 Tax=Halodesulfovibrio aestuarii TaxID=126333 RepID=A0A8G2CBW0_9BACT|nr:GGDEF domain-containing protein [Halodesulfovibrio aestuarii]SHJ66255.1 diguanylate cyclase (GGDEF) domain-containing protein [Halodesulfovibrio aestuarii]